MPGSWACDPVGLMELMQTAAVPGLLTCEVPLPPPLYHSTSCPPFSVKGPNDQVNPQGVQENTPNRWGRISAPSRMRERWLLRICFTSSRLGPYPRKSPLGHHTPIMQQNLDRWSCGLERALLPGWATPGNSPAIDSGRCRQMGCVESWRPLAVFPNH